MRWQHSTYICSHSSRSMCPVKDRLKMSSVMVFGRDKRPRRDTEHDTGREAGYSRTELDGPDVIGKSMIQRILRGTCTETTAPGTVGPFYCPCISVIIQSSATEGSKIGQRYHGRQECLLWPILEDSAAAERGPHQGPVAELSEHFIRPRRDHCD